MPNPITPKPPSGESAPDALAGDLMWLREYALRCMDYTDQNTCVSRAEREAAAASYDRAVAVFDALAAERARVAALQQLAEQWREQAGKLLKHGWLQSIRRDAIEKCANDLARVVGHDA